MQAVGYFIIVSPVREEIKTSSGMVLTASEAKEARYAAGDVISPGNLVQSVQKGDRIYFDSGRSFNMMVSGELVTVIREADVVLLCR